MSHEAVRRKETPLVSLDFNLTFMQVPTVKYAKFVIKDVTSGNRVILCLSAIILSRGVDLGKLSL